MSASHSTTTTTLPGGSTKKSSSILKMVGQVLMITVLFLFVLWLGFTAKLDMNGWFTWKTIAVAFVVALMLMAFMSKHYITGFLVMAALVLLYFALTSGINLPDIGNVGGMLLQLGGFVVLCAIAYAIFTWARSQHTTS